jgi:hypothetical protein
MKINTLPATAALLATLGLAGALPALAAESPEQIQKDVQKHRAMAAAHEAAAKCRESGQDEEVCYKELQASCKGLAIGKFCGMRHEH